MIKTLFKNCKAFSRWAIVLFVLANYFTVQVFAKETETQFNLRILRNDVDAIAPAVAEQKKQQSEQVVKLDISAEEKIKIEQKSSIEEPRQPGQTEAEIDRQQAERLKIERQKMEQQKIISICDVLTQRSTDLLEKLSEIEAAHEQQYLSNISSLKNSRAEQDASLAKSRKDSDTKRGAEYAKLSLRSKTAQQHEAFSDFKMTVELAVKTRRNAVDQAIATQRSGVNLLLDQRRTAVAAALRSLETGTSAALARAKIDCSNGKGKPEIRGQLIAQINSSKGAFETAIKNLQFRSDLQNLAVSEQNSVALALENFRKTVAAATLRFKTGFKK